LQLRVEQGISEAAAPELGLPRRKRGRDLRKYVTRLSHLVT
jgi:hypothetical protein